MTASIKNHREACTDCRTIAPSNPTEPLMPTALPQWPFQAICMDFCQVGPSAYLACADRYSGWLIIYHIKASGSKLAQLKSICREIFSTYGAPEEVSTDGDTIIMSREFQEFLRSWFEHLRGLIDTTTDREPWWMGNVSGSKSSDWAVSAVHGIGEIVMYNTNVYAPTTTEIDLINPITDV